MKRDGPHIRILRFLVFFLALVVVLAIGTFFWIRNTEEDNLSDALSFLRTKDRNLEMTEQCFQKLYEADNDFWLYTLTYRQEYCDNYSRNIDDLLSILDSLRKGMESDPGELILVEQADRSLLQKEDLSKRFIRLKRLADSLLRVVAALGPVYEQLTPVTTSSILRYYPDLKAMGMDTLDLTTTTEREKKGFFRKIREFFVGSKEVTTTRQQVAVAQEAGPADTSATPALTIEEVSEVIAGQTNHYYQNQLRLQQSTRAKMEAREKELILTNKSLMTDLKEILRLLDEEMERRHAGIHENALAAIGRSTRIINLTSMISLGIVLILLILIVVTVGKIIRYQQQLQVARQKAEQDAVEKSRFLAYMSHEIRTPLTSIIGFTEQMKHTPLNPVQDRFLTSMQSSSGILLATVNDILDISRLEAGKMKFFIRPFNPASVMEQVLNSLRPLAAGKGLQMAFTNLIGETTVLAGDEMRLKQVLINLLNNAIKFTDKGEIRLTLSMKPYRSRQGLQVRIEDTGIGISKEHLKDIFSEFSQVHEPAGRKWIIGTGLGLPICKKIVEQQHGRIWVESQPGTGSAFTFVIPYTLSKRPGEEATPPGAEIDPSIFTGKRIMIVDDTEINLVLLEAIFNAWGVQADKARNGREALELTGRHPYHLILSDVNMPELDGIALTKSIRRNPSPDISKIPVIILTANILQDEIGKYLEAGVSDYILKPFLMNDLYQVIRKNLR
jgi:signal transduction histidine kinase